MPNPSAAFVSDEVMAYLPGASRVACEGVHPEIVSGVLRHAQIAMTLDLYSHVTPTVQQQTANALDAFFGGKQ